VPVEPNATGLPSESLNVTAERVIRETIMRRGVFKQYSTTLSIYKYSQIFKLIINPITAYIAKIHLEENTPSLHCREVEYSPLGLYIFGREEEDLALKTLEKIHWFIKSRKNLLCGA
jgi:hypothetical protein